MSIHYTTINGGTRVWMARVSYQGHRQSKVCRTRDEAKQAEARLLLELKAKAGKLETEAAQPATLKQLFELYVADLEARGKGGETIGRAAPPRRR